MREMRTLAVLRIEPQLRADLLEGIRAANAGCARAAVVMLRRMLERACKQAGAVSGTLAAKIETLQRQSLISAVQASSAHAIRAFANEYGAHPDDDFLDDVSDDEIDAAVRLTVFVVEGLARRQTVQR